MFYVYFIESKKVNKIYVGFTEKNPFSRTEEHNKSSNDWTKSRKPFELIYYEEYVCKADALRRENFYKMGFGRETKSLIVNYLKISNIKPKSSI